MCTRCVRRSSSAPVSRSLPSTPERAGAKALLTGVLGYFTWLRLLVGEPEPRQHFALRTTRQCCGLRNRFSN